MKLWELSRNDVPGAVAYYGEKRAGLVPGSPMQQTLVAPLLKLQDDAVGRRELAAGLKKAYPEDFVDPDELDLPPEPLLPPEPAAPPCPWAGFDGSGVTAGGGGSGAFIDSGGPDGLCPAGGAPPPSGGAKPRSSPCGGAPGCGWAACPGGATPAATGGLGAPS